MGGSSTASRNATTASGGTMMVMLCGWLWKNLSSVVSHSRAVAQVAAAEHLGVGVEHLLVECRA